MVSWEGLTLVATGETCHLRTQGGGGSSVQTGGRCSVGFGCNLRHLFWSTGCTGEAAVQPFILPGMLGGAACKGGGSELSAMQGDIAGRGGRPVGPGDSR